MLRRLLKAGLNRAGLNPRRLFQRVKTPPISLPIATPVIYDQWPIHGFRYIVIGTTSICNASCVHCPTNKAITRHLAKAHMPWDLFVKLIDGIRDTGLPVGGQLCFGLFAESLLDPLVVERARYVKEQLPKVPLMINSNGGPATRELAVELEPYVDSVAFHVEAVTPSIYDELMFPLKAEKVFPRIEEFIRWFGKPVSIACPVSTKNLTEMPALREYWMTRGVHSVAPHPFSGRCSDDLPYLEYSLAPGRGDCHEEVAHDLIVDSDGTVLLCCNDFQRAEPIGDLKRETVPELIRNEARKAVHDRLKLGERKKYSTCSNCKIDCVHTLKKLVPY